jgi:uncharacterized protein YecT (DUF1311 family)
MRCRSRFVNVVKLGFAGVFALAACSSDDPKRSRDDIAADSALAADLALANRDTMVVDTIGQYRSPTNAAADSEIAGSLEGKSRPVPGQPAPIVRPVPPPAPAPLPAPMPVPAPAPAPSTEARPVTPAPTPRRATGDPCNSPVAADQQSCVRIRLASVDTRMNRIYRALITEMRRKAGVPPGAKDPPSVTSLRSAQRQWLVTRDAECRRRGKGKEGRLWARPRVACLGEFSAQRANELADTFSRITAQ